MRKIAAWKLWCLLPRLLLFQTRRGGEAGTRNLQQRVALFDEGRCDVLLTMSVCSSRTGEAQTHV